MATFREMIKQLRAERGLSLAEAGELIGCTKAHVYELEHGNSRNPTIQILAGIATAYEADLGELARLAAADAPGATIRAAVAKLVEARREVAEAQAMAAVNHQ